jgi:crotonobetainyl-CoA:carnitine CoA-transferase CaiB-like acyl-CoA transferase
VLDLTRVIAGPVATRFLAGLGADVLRIDPPDWDEPAIVPEMTLGKRAARANFLDAGGMRKLGLLIAEADVIVHGYRADALERLGLGDDEIRAINPGIGDVASDAYGWSGPWRNRRGFDSLVQMSSGIAYGDAGEPSPLPVQALDHATGYLAAAAVLEGLRRRRETGQGSTARLSLARTALELPALRLEPVEAPQLPTTSLETPWGQAALLDSPLTIDGRGLHWSRLPRALGSDKPVWS